MPRGPINRHRGFGDDELPWRYLRRHDHVEIEDDDPTTRLLEVDDYWDPEYGIGALDVQLHRIWQEVINVGFGAHDVELDPRPRRSIAPDDLAVALRDQLARVARAELDGPLDEILAMSRRVPELRQWFQQRRGPALTLLVLEPFWIRSLASWPATSPGDLDALGRSLVDHLLVRYPVPAPLYQPWRSADPPPLKWASWLVLIGQGASLHRAAAGFGWSIPTKLAQIFGTLTDDMSPTEAVMWAEILRLGGARRELAWLRRHPGFMFDPTGPDENALSIDGVTQPYELPHALIRRFAPDDRRPPVPDSSSATFLAFWRATVTWLAHHRDELADAACDAVLDWALHRYIEDRAFSWSGRTPAATVEHARVYRDAIVNAPRARVEPLSWPARGWNWEDDGWSIVELTTAMQLAEESREMHHCVASYAYRCVQGTAAIFSVLHDGVRCFTVEIDPRARLMVQARGVRNRSCNDVELALVRRWLKSTRTP